KRSTAWRYKPWRSSSVARRWSDWATRRWSLPRTASRATSARSASGMASAYRPASFSITALSEAAWASASRGSIPASWAAASAVHATASRVGERHIDRQSYRPVAPGAARCPHGAVFRPHGAAARERARYPFGHDSWSDEIQRLVAIPRGAHGAHRDPGRRGRPPPRGSGGRRAGHA